MKKVNIKIGMKVWHKGYEWEVLHYNEDHLIRLLRLKKVGGEWTKIYGVAKIDEIEEVDEYQTSITPMLCSNEDCDKEVDKKNPFTDDECSDCFYKEKSTESYTFLAIITMIVMCIFFAIYIISEILK